MFVGELETARELGTLWDSLSLQQQGKGEPWHCCFARDDA
jgi:hypothetical protein